MNVSAKITSKGQITLPAKLRNELGLKAGDRVDFLRKSPGKYEIRGKATDFDAIAGSIKTDIVLSLAEVDEAIGRGIAAGRLKARE